MNQSEHNIESQCVTHHFACDCREALFKQAHRLYAYQPKGCGQLSFFVTARSEDEARRVVDKHISGIKNTYSIDGWGTDYYKLTVMEVGEVVVNYND